MAHITHPEIKRLLETHYKNVTVLLTDEMGYAGPYPGMGIDRPQAEAFKQKLIEHHVITGDTARNKVQVMPGGGYSTVKVQVPSDWNELTQAKGYEPIEAFYLNEGEHDLPTEISTINEDNVPVIQQGTMLINQGKGLMDIFYAAGKLVGSTTSTFNLRQLPIGVYMVRVAGVKGACKVVKSH